MGSFGPKATSAPAGAIILHPGDDIAALVYAAPAGATFYFEPGVYRGVSLRPSDGQTFIGAEGAILNGSAVLTDWTQSGNLWVIGGQTQRGPVFPWAEFEAGTERPGYPETVFLNNTPLKPVDDLSKVVAGTFYFDYAADKIYIADNPAGHTVEAGKLTDAFHGTATNVTVQNLVIEKYDNQIQDGAIQGDQSWIIRDNEVRLNYSVGITAHDGSQIIGNYVHDNGQMGLGGHGNNILVQGNELATNGFWSGISPYWEAGGFKFAETDNLVVRGNYSHDNKGSGMWTDINNIHTLYEDNVVVHNTINGIQHEISYDAIIRNNTLVGNGYGDWRLWGWGAEIDIQNSQNVQVYGNRVDMTGGGNGIVMIQQNRGSGTYGTWTTTGNQIHDNTIVDHDGHGTIGGFADYNQSGMLNGGNTWSNNQYFMSDGQGRFQWVWDLTYAQFKTAAHETGSLSQSYPDTSGWLAPVADTTGGTSGGTVAPVVTAALVSDTGASGSDKITTQATLIGTADPNAIVHFTVDNIAIAATATASSTAAWSFTPTGLADGSHTIVAGETSAAGLTGTSALTFTLDTHAPIPTFTGGTLSGGQVTLTGSTGEANDSICIYDGNRWLGFATTGSDGKFSFTAATDSSVTHSYGMNATDLAGNEGHGGSALVLNSSSTVTSPPTLPVVIETVGSTGLVQVDNIFFMDAVGASSDPQLMFGGTPVFASQFGGWTPIGAEAAASGYLVAWKNGASDEYIVWNTDTEGNYLNAIGAVSGSDYGLESLETKFQQDLNSDGQIGPTTTTIEAFGLTRLDESASQFFLHDSAGDGLSLKFEGSAVVSGQFGGWTPIGAEEVASGYLVAWKNGASDEYIVWNTDTEGKYLNAIGTVSGNITGEGNLTLNAHSAAYLEVGGNTMILVNTSNAAETVSTSDTHAADMSITLLGVHLGLTGSDFHHV